RHLTQKWVKRGIRLCRPLLRLKTGPLVLNDGTGIAANRRAQRLAVGSAGNAETVKCDEGIAFGEDDSLGLLVAVPDIVRQEGDQQAEDHSDRAKERRNNAFAALNVSAQGRPKGQPYKETCSR